MICFKVVQTLNELAVDVNILEEQVVDVALLKRIKHEELNKQTSLYILIKKSKTKVWPASIPQRVSRWPNTLDAAAVMF